MTEINGKYYPDPESVPPVCTAYWGEKAWADWRAEQARRHEAIQQARRVLAARRQNETTNQK